MVPATHRPICQEPDSQAPRLPDSHMTIHFFRHTPMPDDMNERRAIYRVARILHERFAGDSDTTVTLIANIYPDPDPVLGLHHLTQLDALLLAPRFAAILEFKNYFDPIVGQSLHSNWHAVGSKGRKEVAGGAKRNPFLQVQNAKYQWGPFLTHRTGGQQPWEKMHGHVLFHPYLNSQSRIPPLGEDHLWFQVRGVDEIGELVNTTRIAGWHMSPGEMNRLAHDVLRAAPYRELHSELPVHAALLIVEEPGQDKRTVPIFCYSDFVMGRRGPAHHPLRLENRKVSRDHLLFEVGMTAIRVYDMSTKNGTFLNGEQIDSERGRLVQDGETILVGARDRGATQITVKVLAASPAGPDTATETA